MLLLKCFVCTSLLKAALVCCSHCHLINVTLSFSLRAPRWWTAPVRRTTEAVPTCVFVSPMVTLVPVPLASRWWRCSVSLFCFSFQSYLIPVILILYLILTLSLTFTSSAAPSCTLLPFPSDILIFTFILIFPFI